MKNAICTVAVLSLLAWSQSVRAEIVQLQAVMDGLQNVPQTPSQGTGVALFELDTDTSMLTLVSGSYQNLLGHLHMAHIHGFAAPGEESGILFMMQHTGGTAGTLSLMDGGISLKEADVQGMLAGLTYISLHTMVFMEGEIRGQILVVPGPSALAVVALAGLVSRRRRRS
jgi:hypothetical protein